MALNRAIAESRVPAKEVLDGVLIIFGGALLLTPGFLTDIVGLLLLIPPTRAIVRGFMRRFVVGRFSAGPRAAMWSYGRVQGRGRGAAPRGPSPAPARGPARRPRATRCSATSTGASRTRARAPTTSREPPTRWATRTSCRRREGDSEGRGTFPG